ncbi:endonuclease domain-containing protein [Micromonospora haikouensis]|uniref:endonuclease domain-containing protein n=1 Tax=Micromonospora haikouensis TaxID=686309 RepID=UPI003D94A4F0
MGEGRTLLVNRSLADVPSDRVVALPDADTDALAMLIARDHAELAAVVHRPAARIALPVDFVYAALDRLEQVAVELLPAWLPEAADGVRPDTSGLAAVRAAAAARSRRDRYPGSFLPDLAVFAVTARRPAGTQLPLRTRAAALARLVAGAFGRRRVVLLVEPAAGTGAVSAAGAAWLVQHGGPVTWLLGAGAAGLEAVPEFSVALPPVPPRYVPPAPPHTARAASLAPPPTARAAPPALRGLSSDAGAVVGRPHPASEAEKRLEAALAAESWAVGRRWNQSYRSHDLATPIRLDLVWPDERCVVEIDGPEHCRPVHFEADRQRDVQLQLDGYAVLRFTNARVTHDVGAVVRQIGTYLRERRRDMAEGRQHGRR